MKKLFKKIEGGIGYIIIPFLIFKDLFFESKEDKESRERKIKDDEARKMFEELHLRRTSLSVTEILNTLISIHSFHELPHYGPWWIESLEKYLIPYQIFSELSQNKNLTDNNDVERFVDMLSWKEIKEPSYNCAWYPIIEVTRKFPTESNIKKIRFFAEYLKSILEIHIERNSGYDQIIRQHITYAEKVSLSNTL